MALDNKNNISVGKSHYQDSSFRQLTGRAEYIDDIPLPENALHGALILSEIPSGMIISIDTEKAKKFDPSITVITAPDIPGKNDIAPIFADEPIFAEKEVTYVGQPIGLIVASSMERARAAVNEVQIVYKKYKTPILDLDLAFKKKSFFLKPIHFERGKANEQIKQAPHKIKGSFSMGGQDHFYLETHIALAIPHENSEFTIWSSTQHPTEVQHGVSNVLNIPAAKISSKVRRLGGGFGGKESQSTIYAAIAALGAYILDKPVKLRLNRKDDMASSGKRHDFEVKYSVGFNKKGKIKGLDITLLSNAGNVCDLSAPVMSRALTHLDNCYSFKDFTARGYICKTNTVSNTAFRGFGGPQGMLAIETILERVSRFLGIDLDALRIENYYSLKNGIKTPYGQIVKNIKIEKIINEMETFAGLKKRKLLVEKFNKSQINKNQPYRKGIAFMPAKFGISFNKVSLNQAGALVHVYTDGSVRLNHGGTEMGQGLFIKVAQVVSECFNIPIDYVHISGTNTDEVPNTSATAASSGSDINGMAAWKAATVIKQRMLKHASKIFQKPSSSIEFKNGLILSGNKSMTFKELALSCWENRISLSSTGFYKTPKISWDQEKFKGSPYFYFTWGAAVSEAIIDIDTGESRILRADIIQDCGSSLNPLIDRGQIEGGFIQGIGWLTCEELYFNPEGKLLTLGPSTYKIPGSRDVPPEFNIKLLENSPNEEKTIFRSKAVGEPPLLLSISHFLALKNALSMASETSNADLLNVPATPSKILAAVYNDHSM